MLAKAIGKINSEISKNANNPYIQVIGNFLLQYLNSNPEAAEKILTEDKTIAKSLDAMKNEAQKKKVGNCAVLTDQEGFTIVLKYFGIEAAASASAPVVIEQSQPKSAEKKAADFNIKLEDLLK